ncbi:hypothetical protein E3N88_22872 [Mikania micrantha]|uniref:Uncharacterized protein n=1 Tax=Mikania micrantha TaxID=192012 RepID=A0A5N6NBN9_9ASTR|nr:hypothetical protein E3N88_22872 [Mikania micrantha]
MPTLVTTTHPIRRDKAKAKLKGKAGIESSQYDLRKLKLIDEISSTNRAKKHEPEPSSYNEGAPAEFANYVQRFKSLRSKDIHIALCKDLMEHLWDLRQANEE